MTLADDARDLRITVYNDNLGLVSDQRELAVDASGASMELADVPAQLDPTSVHLKTAADVDAVEQNFQYDLADSSRIMMRYLGLTVELITKSHDVKAGTLTSFQSGDYVLTDDAGGVNIIRQDQVVDVRLPKLPSGLRTRPTLVWRLAETAPPASRVPVEVSYLTGGISWHAEYVAVCDPQDTTMTVSAWVSIENQAGATFPDARLQLVAGDVNRVREVHVRRKMARGAPQMAMAEDAAHFEEESFFEYHLYSLARRTTIADRETKQIALFPSATTTIEKRYEYRGQQDAKRVKVVLEAENRDDRGLGMPLPAGKVRIYKRDAKDQPQFVGEDKIGHTPKNEKIRLVTGSAFDVVGERREMAHRQVSQRVNETDVEIKLRNRKDQAVTIDVYETLWGDWAIVRATLPHEKHDATTARFAVEVAPDSEVTLEFTARYQH